MPGRPGEGFPSPGLGLSESRPRVLDNSMSLSDPWRDAEAVRAALA